MRKLALALALVFGWNSGASAVPIEWTIASGGNGHWYEEFKTFVNWETARAFAESKSHLGLQGHLVTITSAAERDFLLANNLPDTVLDAGAILGAFQDTSAPDYSEPNGGWRWVTGEPWSFENWDPGAPQPDDFGGGQNFGSLHPVGVWDDIPAFMERTVLVEYSVPEPTTALLLGLGLARMSLRKRRRHS
jgi:hypothetical protein